MSRGEALDQIFRLMIDIVTKAHFKRQTFHVPNLMQMRKIYCFDSFALDSAHVKCSTFETGPTIVNRSSHVVVTTIRNLTFKRFFGNQNIQRK